jgi:hypothetical protein
VLTNSWFQFTKTALVQVNGARRHNDLRLRYFAD